MKTLLVASRYLVVIAVCGSFAAATALLGYAGARTVQLAAEAATGKVGAKGLKALSLGFIEVVDTFLLATVFYIIAVGLYELFIDDTLRVREWLVIRSLDDLKYKLTGVIVVVLAVLFLGQVVTWDGQRDLLGLGAAVALVIAALTYFLSQKTRGEKKGSGGDRDGAGGQGGPVGG